MSAGVIEAALRIRIALGVVCLGLLLYSSALPDYLFEITHDYDGPVEGIVTYLNAHAAPDDVVAITYGDLPVKFYTGMRVIGGLTGESLKEAVSADWVVLRRHVISQADLAVRQALLAMVPVKRYRVIPLSYPDIPFENRAEPAEHKYRTVTGMPQVLLLQKK
ncbi:MAG: hypothetical protein GY868_00170 [Deltaproteobacteria bacterium]|nr:hypothetical protein [Deltaproteobacteria bacterium]